MFHEVGSWCHTWGWEEKPCFLGKVELLVRIVLYHLRSLHHLWALLETLIILKRNEVFDSKLQRIPDSKRGFQTWAHFPLLQISVSRAWGCRWGGSVRDGSSRIANQIRLEFFVGLWASLLESGISTLRLFGLIHRDDPNILYQHCWWGSQSGWFCLSVLCNIPEWIVWKSSPGRWLELFFLWLLGMLRPPFHPERENKKLNSFQRILTHFLILTSFTFLHRI